MKKVFHQFQGATLDDYHPHHESQIAAKEIVGKYIQELDINRQIGRGLTISGPVGVGKTMLASIVLSEAVEKGYRIESIMLSGYIDLILETADKVRLVAKYDDEDLLDEWMHHERHLREIKGTVKRSADFVLFDDVGHEFESRSGWSNVMFYNIIRQRYIRGLPTLLTSNQVPSEWAERYSEGMTSFLQESTITVPVVGTDYREHIQSTWSEDS